MKLISVLFPVILVMLISSTMAFSEDALEYISSVEIYPDRYICGTCAQEIKANLMQVPGVDKVTVNMENGTIMVTPKTDGGRLNIYDLWMRMDTSREYVARKMDVLAQGHIVKVSTSVFKGDEEFASHVKYEFRVGQTDFLLFENDKLKELIDSGHTSVRIMGTVAAFSHEVPILVIGNFEEPVDIEKSELLQKMKDRVYRDPLDMLADSLTKEEEIMKRSKHAHIDSLRIYVDTGIHARDRGEPMLGANLKEILMKEEGVAMVSIAPEASLVEIMPKDNEMLFLYNIWRDINSERGFKVIKMDVVASGEVNELGEKYPSDLDIKKRLQPRTHYMLSAGSNTGFLLAENSKLKELLNSRYKMVTVIGTVTTFKAEVPVLEIKDFQQILERPEWLNR